MWRYLTRNFQQSFKRRACIDKQDKNVNNEKTCNTNQHKCCIAELFPCTNKNLHRFASKFGCSSHGKQEFHDKSNINHHSLFEAFGWSGALVFGWVISKQLWFKQRFIFDKEERSGDIFDHSRLFKLLAQIARTQPPTAFVLPQIPSNHTTVDANKSKCSNTDLDEFESAAEELKKVHEQILGEALNRRGIASISRSTGVEAITYFQKASKFNYPPASFNMGQCYELGIGTKQDFKQAAEWYKIASDQGHATAMYNLGVFYAHGWGGLRADIAMAKQLFVKAANLGQPDAKAALSKESKSRDDQLYESKISDIELIQNSSENRKTTEMKTFEYQLFANSIQTSLNDEIRLKPFSSDKEWNISFNSAVAF